MPVESPDAPRRVVLDTNVVLDWLYFGDASCRALDSAIRASLALWVGTAAMRAELEHVLTREPFSSKPEIVVALLATLDSTMVVLETAPAALGAAGHCSDADDQKFIDLALHLGEPTQLISRDRAVLRMARVAERHGVKIVSIADWRAPERFSPKPAVTPSPAAPSPASTDR